MTLTRQDCLLLYEKAVQCPQAELHFMLRCFDHYHGHQGQLPSILREDFCGTAAISRVWVDYFEAHEAVAIDHDATCIELATRIADGQRLSGRLSLIENDVLAVADKADIIASLNFSTLIYHDLTSLIDYFKHALGCLNGNGILVLDVFDGPGCRIASEQRRDLAPAEGEHASLLSEEACKYDKYVWHQRSYDSDSQRIDCRIHFELEGHRHEDAFVYDWRLWSPADLCDAMKSAGFSAAEIWGMDEEGGYVPLEGTYQMPEEDGVYYVIGSN